MPETAQFSAPFGLNMPMFRATNLG